MKQIELQLQKRLLIVEVEKILPKYNTEWWFQKRKDKGVKLICKGSDLTEEITKGLVDSSDNFQFLDAENTFIVEIEKNGYYWRENPLGEEPRSYSEVLDGVDPYDLMEDLEQWQEAESKTFNPAKTLIFEIL